MKTTELSQYEFKIIRNPNPKKFQTIAIGIDGKFLIKGWSAFLKKYKQKLAEQNIRKKSTSILKWKGEVPAEYGGIDPWQYLEELFVDEFNFILNDTLGFDLNKLKQQI